MDWVVCYVFIRVDVVVELIIASFSQYSLKTLAQALKPDCGKICSIFSYMTTIKMVPSSGKPHLCRLPVLWQFSVDRLSHAKLI